MDGFIAGPDDAMDWVFEHAVAPNAPNAAAEEVIRTTGAVTITFRSGDVRQAVATAPGAAESKNLLVLGADVSRQCLDEGLVEEILIHLAPVLLGDGVRLFGAPGSRRINLEMISATQSGQRTNLRFGVAKQLRERQYPPPPPE